MNESNVFYTDRVLFNSTGMSFSTYISWKNTCIFCNWSMNNEMSSNEWQNSEG